MSLSSIVSRIVPAAIGFATGGPVGAFTATVATEKAKTQQKKIQTQNAILAQERENFNMNYPSGFDPVTGNLITNTTSANAGNRGFFDGISDFFTTAGRTVRSAFDSGIPQLLGVGRPRGTSQQPAITTVTNVGAQESQGSGSIQAGMGSLLPTLVSGARSLLKSPIGQTAIGTGAGFGLSLLGADGKPMRMTRKMKAQARSLLNMTGGNLSVTADFLGISELLYYLKGLEMMAQ